MFISVNNFLSSEKQRIRTQIWDVTVVANLLLVLTMNLEAHFVDS